MQIALVKFIDLTFYDYWGNLDEIDKAKANFCYTCGWLLEDGEEYVKIVSIVDGARTQGRSWVVIPQECVVSCDIIREVDWEVQSENR